MVQRGLHQNVTQLEPQRKILADKYNGDPLDCVGGVINDLTADSKGGVYYSMGGVYHASAAGVVTKYGENINPNGIVLSADEKTLYVTNGATMAAFDVQPDGSLKNQREFAKLTAGGGDGSTIDAAGRVYVTTQAGVEVLGPDGKNLGVIPTPRGVITGAFGGKDKKTFYILARGATDANGTEVPNAAQVWAIQMQAQPDGRGRIRHILVDHRVGEPGQRLGGVRRLHLGLGARPGQPAGQLDDPGREIELGAHAHPRPSRARRPSFCCRLIPAPPPARW